MLFRRRIILLLLFIYLCRDFAGFAGMMGRGDVSFIRLLEELKLHVRAIVRIILNMPLFLLSFS